MARRILGLEGAPARIWARLAARVGEVFRPEVLEAQGFDGLEPGLNLLQELDLVHGSLPRRMRAAEATADELRASCARLGLPTRGRRAELEERLLACADYTPPPALRLAGRSLVRRLERLWFRGPWQERSLLVRERLGVTRWPGWPTTAAAAPLRDRAELLALEALWAGERPDTPEATLEALQRVPEALEPRGPFDTRRILRHHALEQLRELERAGEAARAARLYTRLLALHPSGATSLRLALALEADGRQKEAFEACEQGLSWASEAERLGLARTGRRLGRASGRMWRPDPPLRTPLERALVLPTVEGEDRRLRWGAEGLPIELACAQALAPRVALWGENGLWTTLFGLLFADLYALPVPGMLPTRFLAGPLDLGTPAFAERRREAVQARLAQVRAGQGAAWVARHAERYAGVVLGGVSWGLAPAEVLVRAAAELGGEALGAGMSILLEQGWSAARGLPDLVVLAGPPVVLPEGLPATLPPGLLLVEIKGPSDSLRDEQRVWHDRLLRAGATVELWRVKERR